jgi:hypothetical protein
VVVTCSAADAAMAAAMAVGVQGSRPSGIETDRSSCLVVVVVVAVGAVVVCENETLERSLWNQLVNEPVQRKDVLGLFRCRYRMTTVALH